MGIVISLALLGVYFYICSIIAGLFKDVAYSKGASSHEQRMAWRLCFWLGAVGYIYVAALPNHTAVPSQTSNVEQIIPKASWKCPQCGRYNANYVGTCGCGTRKP